MLLYYSDFNDPNELSNYYYNSDSYRGVRITNGYLEVFLGLYGKAIPYAMTCTAVYKNPFPSTGIRIRARVSAMDGSNMSRYADVVSGVKIQSVSGFNQSDPAWSNQQIHFGFSTPYLTVIYINGNDPERVYQSGSWNGSDTGWYTLEVELYNNEVKFYVNGQLVYTLNRNPFIGDQVYVGIIAGSRHSGSYARADWLEVNSISTVVDMKAYSGFAIRQEYIYTPYDTTAYPGITTQQTYTPPPPVYTPVDAKAYSALTLEQEYTMPPSPVYTPIDARAYQSLTLEQEYIPPPTLYTPINTRAYQSITLKQKYIQQQIPQITLSGCNIVDLSQLVQILLMLMIANMILRLFTTKKEE